MSLKSRAWIASIAGTTLFSLAWFIAGWLIGYEQTDGTTIHGLEAALKTTGIATGTMLALAGFSAIFIGLAQWITQGD